MQKFSHGSSVVEATISDCDDDELSAASVDDEFGSKVLSVYSPPQKKSRIKTSISKKSEWHLLEQNASEQLIQEIKRDYPHVKKGGWSKNPYNSKRAISDDDVTSRYVRFKLHNPSDDSEGIGTEILMLTLRNGRTTVSSRTLLKEVTSKSTGTENDKTNYSKNDDRFEEKLNEFCNGTLFAAHLLLLHGINTNILTPIISYATHIATLAKKPTLTLEEFLCY